MFDQFVDHDVVSWSALVSGNVQHGFSEKAIRYFRRMQADSVSPSVITFVSNLKACGNIGNIGGDIYWEVPKQRYPEVYLILGIAWLDM